MLEYSTREGGWITIPKCSIEEEDGCTTVIDFGPSPGLTNQVINIRFTNLGGSALIITKSKPLEGTEMGATAPNVELSEGMQILPGQGKGASIVFAPTVAILNDPPREYSADWVLNCNDMTFGVHILRFTGSVVSKQVGPKLDDGSAQFKYLGCYQDTIGGRLFPQSVSLAGQTNGLCQEKAFTSGAVFAGTEYQKECWYGSAIVSPGLKGSEIACSYACDGDASESCGGYGGYMSLYYDSTRYFPANGTIIGGTGRPPGIVQSVGDYEYSGCWSEATGGRALTGQTYARDTNTVENCAAFCSGFAIFGVEYGTEVRSLSFFYGYTDSDKCSVFAGILWQRPVPCSPIPTAPLHALGIHLNFVASITLLYVYIFIETDSLEGAGRRLLVYNLDGNLTAPPPSSSSTASPTIPATPITATSLTATSVPSGPAVVGSVGDYTYIECRSDVPGGRTLTGKTSATGLMTVELCATTCAGFLYMGVEYGREVCSLSFFYAYADSDKSSVSAGTLC